MSQVEQDQPPAPAPPPGDDPLSHLHKMSTTAGLGSTEYVAISPTAILAFVAGLAGFFLLFDLEQPILLIIPLTALVTGFVAFRQIAKSNGTQTGRSLATVGMVLGLAFIALFTYRALTNHHQAKKDEAGIESALHELGQAIIGSDYDKAYALFTDRFHQRVPAAAFADIVKGVHGNSYYGNLQDITWKHLADYQSDESGQRVAAASIIFVFEKVPEIRQNAIFRHVANDKGERWLFDDIPYLFPAKKEPGQPGP